MSTDEEPFWKVMDFSDLLRRQERDDTPPTVSFLGVELPFPFDMPTVVAGVPRGFDLYELAIGHDGKLNPAAFGPGSAALGKSLRELELELKLEREFAPRAVKSAGWFPPTL